MKATIKRGRNRNKVTRFANERRATPSLAGYLVCGRNTVEEILKKRADRVVKLFIGSRTGKEALGRMGEIRALAEQNGIEIVEVDPAVLDAALGTGSHQSLAAQLIAPEYQDLKGWLASEGASCRTLLMLDSIEDPQNFGALIRAAECFGVDAVIWSKNRGVSITPVVTKAAVGATELVTLIPVSNLAQSAELIKEAGYWMVVADSGKGSADVENFQFPEKTLLVMGAEGHGVQPLLKKMADYTISIKMHGEIDSLNVSQATAVLLAAIARAIAK